MSTDKVPTLLGFAMKAGKVIYGCDSIERYHKRKYLLMVCRTLSPSAREKLVRTHERTPVVITTVTLAELTHRDGCKALALTDGQMANAILDNMNGSYHLVTEVK